MEANQLVETYLAHRGIALVAMLHHQTGAELETCSQALPALVQVAATRGSIGILGSAQAVCRRHNLRFDVIIDVLRDIGDELATFASQTAAGPSRQAIAA